MDVPGRATVSSFGFSGSNAHVLLEAAPRHIAASDDPGPWIFPLSAKTTASLDRLKTALLAHLDRLDGGLADLAWTLGAKRTHHRARHAVVAGDRVALAAALRAPLPPASSTAADIDIEHAIATRDLMSLATAYVAGAAVPFPRLFRAPGRVLRLPVYPFDNQRYWNPLNRGATAVAEPDDGALPLRVDSADWRLDQHRVDGAPMLPAAAVMELAAAALTRRHGHPCPGLADLTWIRPIAGTGP
ncbi:ketoacyl-synthetase C-terminal extension domain-containing protein, partial [Azospirillum sp. B4]